MTLEQIVKIEHELSIMLSAANSADKDYPDFSDEMKQLWDDMVFARYRLSALMRQEREKIENEYDAIEVQEWN